MKTILLDTSIDYTSWDIDETGSIEMTEWQPIETAPEGAVDLLVFCPPYREKYSDMYGVFHAKRDGEDFFVPSPDSTCGNWETLLVVPTHWMPLPPPPKKGDE